jgi:transposase, IS6 family
MTDREQLLEELRPVSFAIAYRMLGSVSEAEDLVQEALLRVNQAFQAGEQIASPRAFIATVTTRLAINELHSARARRESYVGEWLPEPIITHGDDDPARHAETADSLSLAMLVLLESLSPEQRAVLLLHDVFDYGYPEIAAIVGKSEDNVRRHCCIGRLAPVGETGAMRPHRYPRPCPAPRSAFTGYRFPPEVITLAVRWYLRFGLSYRDVEELLSERGIEVDHVSIYRWVQRFAPEFAEAARARQHLIGDRWHVDESYVKVGGIWRYLFRAIDQFGQVIDVYLSPRRDAKAARRFFERAIDRTRISPVEVTTDRYRVYPRVVDDLLPAAFHDTEVHANNPIETDHGRLKARLRPMRGLKRDRTARVIVAGHAFVQNLRRGFYDLGTDVPPAARLAEAFDELALVI